MSAQGELPGVAPAGPGPGQVRPSTPRSLVGLVRVPPARQAEDVPLPAPSSAGASRDEATGTPPALLLTIEEAAERLQVGRCTMQALLLSGEVQSFKIGRLRRVPPAALEAYIRRRMAP